MRLFALVIVLTCFGCKTRNQSMNEVMSSTMTDAEKQCVVVSGQQQEFDQFWAPVTSICSQETAEAEKYIFELYEEHDLVQQYNVHEKAPTDCSDCRQFVGSNHSVQWMLPPEGSEALQLIQVKEGNEHFSFIIERGN